MRIGDTVQYIESCPELYGQGSVGTITDVITVDSRDCFTVTFPDESTHYAFDCELRKLDSDQG